MRFFAISIEWVEFPFRVFGLAGGNLLCIVVVAVAKLVELEVGILAVGIALDTLESAKEQGLAHDAQVLAEWVHDLDASGQRQLFKWFII